ncbi:DUF4870 domain-containing protein [Oceanobacillus oncorhynchi]|uniref:DUF4870 domain-containing protein n=1 Tax=Oceanobacillus oncorhynchi TaxID=545501 RepID=A0A0A1MT36_9BACI|nr:DUF4870 domain-containing protein [Oceanobacillus oncorhynchi]MDM8100774.1 DUF4870 domain-containing protein [Oceanobacillus oncorhynchi]CEI82794.1 hypothetical protein BN997_02680 [Oceanobacillus oncorhynchi]
MEGNKLLSSLCYFSIFFAPFLFPILVWILGDEETKGHAKKALWTHLIPIIATIIAGIIIFSIGIGQVWTDEVSGRLFIAMIIAIAVCFIIDVYYFIWNIVKGIKVLSS